MVATVSAAAAQTEARAARAVLEVDLAAIEHNFKLIESICSPAKMMAVVKGNAYGLGAAVVADTLQKVGVPALAVDNVAEGIELRECGITTPILIIDGDIAGNAPLAVAHNLMPGIAHEKLLAAYDETAMRRGRKHPVWLVSNVGFNRSGYRSPEKFKRFADRAQRCRHLEVKGVYAHLSNSNGDAQITLVQMEDFEGHTGLAKQIFGEDLEISLFASHGLLRWARTFPTDWVRPGILLYGEHNFLAGQLEPEAAELLRRFQPAVSLKARITHLVEFTDEEGVGYGQQHRVKAGQCLATVAMGFGGGYPSPAPKAYALVHGQRVPVFGEIGMDALQLDVGRALSVEPYDWVTLIGRDGVEQITVHDLSQATGISPYELLRRLHCHRSYINTSSVTS